MRRRPGLLLSLLLTTLTGCSGTPFGEALSGSFSPPAPAARASGAGTATNGATPGSPAAAPRGPAAVPPAASRNTGTGGPSTPPPASSAPSSAGASSAGRAPGSSGSSTATTTGSLPTAAGGAPRATPATAAPTSPPRPAPYRVTILLPQADAAAPAEVVTQALRAAGVPFEVETIERLGRTAPSQPPTGRPAPEPR